MRWTVWCNRRFRLEADRRLREGLAGHRLVMAETANEHDGPPDPRAPGLEQADIAFGQPPAEACLAATTVRWVQVSTAGYTRYDTPEIREGLRARGAAFTSSSSVFADPCAQHALAMMLAIGRQLLPSYDDQRGERPWNYDERRYQSSLLTGQTVVLLGYGAIARRLVELLQPFRCRLFALRRRARSELGVRIVAEEDLTRVLPLADHVINLLPDTPLTKGWMNARRFSCLRPGARFYNLGRGATVDQQALRETLESGRLGAAYLDVAEPEPLPPADPLWSAPRCYITPHTAGGRPDQDEAVVAHFLSNLEAFGSGRPLADRVV